MIRIGNESNLLGSTPQPTYKAVPTPAPTYAPQTASVSTPISPVFFIIGAVIVGALAVLLFFREKNLTNSSNQ